MKEKLVRLLTEIFAWGITFCFVFAFAVALCYVAAFLIGGSFAANLCSFITAKIFPPVYVASGLLTVVGILKMYLNGEKVFLMDLSHKNESESPTDQAGE